MNLSLCCCPPPPPPPPSAKVPRSVSGASRAWSLKDLIRRFSVSPALVFQAIRCTQQGCPCECFAPGKACLRYCETCNHGWVAHGQSVCLSVFFGIWWIVCLSTCLPACLSVCLFVAVVPVCRCGSARPVTVKPAHGQTVCLSFSVFDCLSAYLPACMSVCLSLWFGKACHCGTCNHGWVAHGQSVYLSVFFGIWWIVCLPSCLSVCLWLWFGKACHCGTCNHVYLFSFFVFCFLFFSIWLSVCLPVCLSSLAFECLSAYLPVCLSVCRCGSARHVTVKPETTDDPSVCLFVCPSFLVFDGLSVCLPAFLLSAYVSVCLSVSLSVCLSLWFGKACHCETCNHGYVAHGQSVCLSVFLLFGCLSVCLFVRRCEYFVPASTDGSVSLFWRLIAYLSVCSSLSVFYSWYGHVCLLLWNLGRWYLIVCLSVSLCLLVFDCLSICRCETFNPVYFCEIWVGDIWLFVCLFLTLFCCLIVCLSFRRCKSYAPGTGRPVCFCEICRHGWVGLSVSWYFIMSVRAPPLPLQY